MPDKNKILVVEDNDFVRMQIVRYLGQTGAEIIEASQGDQAFDFMKQQHIKRDPVTLAIVDVRMEPVDGFEFIKHIRASGFFKDIPLIVLSSYENSSTRINCFRLGADDYLIKPFNPEELEVRVENIVKRSIMK